MPTINIMKLSILLASFPTGTATRTMHISYIAINIGMLMAKLSKFDKTDLARIVTNPMSNLENIKIAITIIYCQYSFVIKLILLSFNRNFSLHGAGSSSYCILFFNIKKATIVGITDKMNINLKCWPKQNDIRNIINDPTKDPAMFIMFLVEYARLLLEAKSAIIVSDGTIRMPFASLSIAFAKKTNKILKEQAKRNLLKIVKIEPSFNIGVFLLTKSMKKPEHSRAKNDKKITPPSSRPKDFVLQPSSSITKTGMNVNIMVVAMPQ